MTESFVWKNRRVWIGGGLIVISAFVMKQYIWSIAERQITRNRNIEHEDAVKELNLAHARAKLMHDNLHHIIEAKRSKNTKSDE